MYDHGSAVKAPDEFEFSASQIYVNTTSNHRWNRVQARPMFKKQVLAEKYGEGSANVIVISDVVWIEL
ncbi:hypothetical protein Y032_0500g2578 [Ancylostoma ceylanicum]|uniref:Uncharacterized protein n=1 Tax=Ancylostoma ceylanicum TaxID=53326 RepID=A0A016WUD3_9BILA|nr:hypothetical protein Y032_0500g2578 [Ancylostoma ceylanicum]